MNYFAARLERGNFVAFKTLFLSYTISLVLSIDVALVAILPLIVKMKIKNKKELFLLSSFTAHAGAALMPFGTPQNLFIYSFYDIDSVTFIKCIFPFSFFLFFLFILVSISIPSTKVKLEYIPKIVVDKRSGTLFVIALLIVILAVLGLFDWYVGVISIIVATFVDREALKIDYALLFTFVLFIGISNGLKEPLSKYFIDSKQIFFLSSLLSQAISNVPTTLLLHQFTPDWKALLWGSNVGGFGTPIAALANLITYRIYASYHTKEESFIFLKEMVLWGFLIYIIGILLYQLVN